MINDYPLADDATSMTSSPASKAGIPKIIEFMNAWARRRRSDARSCWWSSTRTCAPIPRASSAASLEFFGQQPTDAELEDAVTFASIDNMRRMETENASKAGAQRSMKPGDANDPSSFKVRRGKVGGWRDYVTEEQADAIDAHGAREARPRLRLLRLGGGAATSFTRPSRTS